MRLFLEPTHHSYLYIKTGKSVDSAALDSGYQVLGVDQHYSQISITWVTQSLSKSFKVKHIVQKIHCKVRSRLCTMLPYMLVM